MTEQKDCIGPYSTVCSRSSDTFYRVSYYIKWVTTSRTCSRIEFFFAIIKFRGIFLCNNDPRKFILLCIKTEKKIVIKNPRTEIFKIRENFQFFGSMLPGSEAPQFSAPAIHRGDKVNIDLNKLQVWAYTRGREGGVWVGT